MKIHAERLRQLLAEVQARGGEASPAAFRGARETAGAAWIELEDACWHELTHTCRALGIPLPDDGTPRPLRGRYYRGCRG